MDTTNRNDRAVESTEPEFDRLKALLENTSERIDAGEDAAEVTSEAHELLDGGY